MKMVMFHLVLFWKTTNLRRNGMHGNRKNIRENKRQRLYGGRLFYGNTWVVSSENYKFDF
jgi:hypothetical protein